MEKDDTRALITLSSINRRISIKIEGRAKREFLAIIRSNFDSIHKSIHNISVKELIPCQCTPGCSTKFNYNLLCRTERMGVTEIICDATWNTVSISKLLDGFEKKQIRGNSILSTQIIGDIYIPQVDLKRENLIVYSANSSFFRNGMIPYYYGTYIQDRTKFYGRVDEQKEVLRLLNQASQKNYWHISVIGDYRSGKSSLLKILEDEIQLQLKSVSVYIDLSTVSQATFFQSVLSAVGESVFAKSNNNALIKKFKQIIDTKQVESIKSLGFELDVFKILKIKTSPKNSESWELFKIALIALFKRLKEFGDFHSIVIIIDEVSAITTWDNPKEILKQWRGMAQNISGYNFVVGSAYPLYQLTKNEWSPFFNIFTQTKLNKLQPNEAEELINQPAGQVGLKFKKDLVKRIRDLSGDNPYYIQVICSTICQRLLKMGPNVKIDEDFIDLCIDHAIEILKDHLLSLWEKATPFQQQLLIDCTKSTPEYHTIDFKNLDTNCKTEVMLLSDRGLIERNNDSIEVCGILSCWLKNYI